MIGTVPMSAPDPIAPTPNYSRHAVAISAPRGRGGQLVPPAWQEIQRALFVSFVGGSLWVSLMFVGFRNSTQLWPAVAVAAVAIAAAVVLCRSAVIQWMLVTGRLATLLTVFAASVPIALTLLGAIRSSRAEVATPLLPYAPFGIAPVHWVSICAAGAGVVIGMIAIGIEARRRSRIPVIVAALSCGACLCYVVLWVSFLVSTLGAIDEQRTSEPMEPLEDGVLQCGE
jgi:hypothetical protein